MSLTLGAITFDEQRTTVREDYEEVGGRNARVVTLEGLVESPASLTALEADLDALLAQASQEDLYLSLRPGRRMRVQRTKFERERARNARAARFALRLEVSPPYEEADTESSQAWSLSGDGDTLNLLPGGNRETLPVITLTAQATLLDPVLSDGLHSLAYAGEVATGASLRIDGPEGRVLLNDEDVTPYTEGRFPRLAPAGSQLSYSDAEDSGHLAQITVAWRSRWW